MRPNSLSSVLLQLVQFGIILLVIFLGHAYFGIDVTQTLLFVILFLILGIYNKVS